VAAEQGAVGVIGYLVLLAAALWTFFSGIRAIAPGLGAPFVPLGGEDRAELAPARIGVAVAFFALLIHTVGYAAYLTDPLTWVLLALGGVLAAEVGAGEWPHEAAESSSPAESAAPPNVSGASSASRPAAP
jgi:hypothetical protein